MNERMADTVVEIFRQTASMLDIAHLATKDDLKQLELATRADILETKLTLRNGMAQLEVRLSERIRMQGWSLLGGMAVLLVFYTAMAKLIG